MSGGPDLFCVYFRETGDTWWTAQEMMGRWVSAWDAFCGDGLLDYWWYRWAWRLVVGTLPYWLDVPDPSSMWDGP